MDNNLEIIQVNEQLELHLGYIGGQSVGGIQEETDPIYTADKPNIALKSEIPVKVSDLQNDSGFISSIPQNLVTQEELNNKGYLTEFTQNDPVYSKDKPNIALKSELFSKSYNDLTEKPAIPTKTSELQNDSGFITLADVPEGGETVDLSNYTTEKSINVKVVNSEGNLLNGIQIDGDYACYGKSKTTYIDFYAQFFKFWTYDSGDGYPQRGVDFSNTYNVKLPEDTTINGMKLKLNQQKCSYYGSQISIYPTSNQFIEYIENQQYISINITDNAVHDFTVVFSTGSECTVDISVPEGQGFIINKPFNFQPDKKYILFQYYSLIVWSEIQNYE